jgi:iron complex transport system ATP-binding protein
VIGPNGCGKTTLIKLMAGILTGACGRVSVFGEVMNRVFNPAKILAYVPQSLSFSFSLSVLDFVLLGVQGEKSLLGKISRLSVEKAREALSLLGMEDYAERDMHRLSGGERQKIILCKALAQNAPLILLDEPAAHLDLAGQLETLELLSALAVTGNKKIIAVMHDVNFASRYSDYVLVMKDGSLFASGKTPDTLTPEILERCFSVRVEKCKDFFIPVKSL